VVLLFLQGFPDYHVFVGLAAKGQGKNGHGKGAATENERYMQVNDQKSWQV